MTKELQKVHGTDVNYVCEEEIDAASSLLLTMTRGPLVLSYYELVDGDGNVVHIIDSSQPAIAHSAAARLGLDYRLVEFNVTFEKDKGGTAK